MRKVYHEQGAIFKKTTHAAGRTAKRLGWEHEKISLQTSWITPTPVWGVVDILVSFNANRATGFGAASPAA